jgi:hypothetical protein
VITEHAAGRLVYDAHYLEIEHTDGIVVVQGLLSADRTTEEEQAFYARATDFLARGALRAARKFGPRTSRLPWSKTAAKAGLSGMEVAAKPDAEGTRSRLSAHNVILGWCYSLFRPRGAARRP